MSSADKRITTNQVVAYNLARIRKTHGMTQEQAAELLAPFVGATWSKKVYSAAERSYDGGRVRQFTADDLMAFSLAFGVPVWYFFVPPKPDDRAPDIAGVRSGSHDVSWAATFDAITGREGVASLMRIWELPEDDRPPRKSRVYRALAALTTPEDDQP